MSWQMKTWGLAQAGNRAGKTGLYLQWWDSNAEQQALGSAVQKLCYFSPPLLPFLFLSVLFRRIFLSVLAACSCQYLGCRRAVEYCTPGLAV